MECFGENEKLHLTDWASETRKTNYSELHPVTFKSVSNNVNDIFYLKNEKT